MRILVDTNILLRLRDVDSPDHGACATALQAHQDAGDDLFVCTQVCIEYWVVGTRPISANGLGLTPADMEEDLRDIEGMSSWLPEPEDIGARWRTLVSQHAVRGRPAHDARLVAVMQAHGIAHILTLNGADFARYPDVRILSPYDV